MPKVGILGSLVWDQIYGRDPLAEPVEEWGGIAYALASLDASVGPGWEIVPLIKVGQDLAGKAREFLGGLRHVTPGGRCVEVPAPNNRVVLHYYSTERRTERMSGGVPGWTWSELGPMVRDLDALYLNFISGFELALGTAQALRQGFRGPIYVDLHSLLLGMQHDGVRVPRPLQDSASWLGCFDVIQLNEDEMRQLSPDPLSLAAEAIGAGTSLLIVTLAAKGAAYVAAPGFDGWAERRNGGTAEGGLDADRRSSPLPPFRRSAADPSPHRPHPSPHGRRARPHRLRRRVRRGGRGAAVRGRPGGDGDPARECDGGTECGVSRGGRTFAALARGTGAAVTRVIEVPAHFDDRSFDQFAGDFGAWPPEEKLLVDARGAQWASPYGLIGLLTAGQAVAEARLERPLLTVPNSDEVKRYWARVGFFRHAAELFELHGRVPKATATGPSDVLLDVTPVRAMEDVHQVVEKISETASRILHGELGLERNATMRFSMALSESCQNIVEHAGTSGWVAVQVYTFRRRLGRRVAVIAVSDAGIGFRRSLESTHAKRFGERWGDGAALEAALIQGVSRFRDPGRGQGLAGIKGFLDRWKGKISIRSGTARLAIVPMWDDDVPLADHLPFFPGAQVQITIPATQEVESR